MGRLGKAEEIAHLAVYLAQTSQNLLQDNQFQLMVV